MKQTNLNMPDQATSHDVTRLARPNNATREKKANGPPEHAQGSKWKIGCPNVHKAPEQSQISKTDTGALERNGSTRTRPVGRPHMVRHSVLD